MEVEACDISAWGLGRFGKGVAESRVDDAVRCRSAIGFIADSISPFTCVDLLSDIR